MGLIQRGNEGCLIGLETSAGNVHRNVHVKTS
jgi:hypothetical protein